MTDLILEYLTFQVGVFTTRQIITNFLVASLIACVIYVSYRFSHSGVVYSPKFNLSLAMLTIITTLVMTVIGNNIAISLGMVGALSIVRFRTAIKDPRDTAYIFWAIAGGITSGVSQYLVAGIGTSVLFFFLLIFGRVQSNDRYLLIIRGDRKNANAIENIVSVYYRSNARMRVKNTTKEDIEYIYELSQRMLNGVRQQESIMDKLYEVVGVKHVNLVCQNDEITG